MGVEANEERGLDLENLKLGYALIRAALRLAEDEIQALQPIELANCLAFVAIETVGDAYGKDRLREWYEHVGELLGAYEEDAPH